MASTTSKMALAVWDKLSDVFAHDTIRQNLLKVDVHDHTTGKGSQIPAAGIKDGVVTAAKLASGLGADTAYREVAMGRATFFPAQAQGGGLAPYGSVQPQSGEGHSTVFYFDPADWGVTAGQTGKLKFTGHLATDGTAPAANITFAIYPVNGHTGGVLALGAVLPNSSTTFTAPAANTLSSPFALTGIAVPAAGLYVIWASPSATTAAGSHVALYARLLVRNG